MSGWCRCRWPRRRAESRRWQVPSRGRRAPPVRRAVLCREGEPPPLAVAPFGPEQAKQHQQAWADYLGLPVEWKNSLGMQFVLIPPGEFLMGSSEEEQTRFREEAITVRFDEHRWMRWIPAEGPQHRVQISQPFYLGKHEVTQAQWEAVMGHNPSSFKAPANPVENVSWHDIQIFLKFHGRGQTRCAVRGNALGGVGDDVHPPHGSPMGICLSRRNHHGILATATAGTSWMSMRGPTPIRGARRTR